MTRLEVDAHDKSVPSDKHLPDVIPLRLESATMTSMFLTPVGTER